MTYFHPADEGILGLCGHGKTSELDQSPFKPEWLQSEVARQVVAAAISLAREGRKVEALPVIARARLSDRAAVPEVMRIFKNGYGSATVQDAIQHSYQEYTLDKARGLARETLRLAESDPQNVSKWLPRQTSSQVQLIREGETYDPRPSAHAKKKLPAIFTTSLITNMTDLLRGGYRNGFLKIYAGVTKHGKSVTLNSHAVDLILQKYKVVVIRTENTEQAAVAEIACAMTGISLEKEVLPNIFLGTPLESPEERRLRYNRMVEYLDDYLEVYDYNWFNDERLKRIAKWSHPDAIIVDYFKKQTGLFARKTSSSDELGDFADFLLIFAKDEGIWFGTAGQINHIDAKKLVKKDTSEPVIVYGTSRIGFAADEFTFLKRHPRLPNTAYFRVQLDRYTGRLDSVHDIPFSVQRRILQINRLEAQTAVAD